MLAGAPREDIRKGEEAALQWAAELGRRVGVPSGDDPVWALVHHMLQVEVPAHWSPGYVRQQESLARAWLDDLLELPCNELRQTHLESVVTRLRKAGRSAETERQVRGFVGWSPTVAAGGAPGRGPRDPHRPPGHRQDPHGGRRQRTDLPG